MATTKIENNLWVEKYRPQSIDECILTKDIKDTFLGIRKSGVIPNMLLSGPAGTGKTTTAKAICNDLNCEVLFINSSLERNIDTLRTKITAFCSTISLYDQQKVVILDEGDYMNAESTQPALRSFIESFSKNARFIITCNFPDRFMDAIRSRFSNIDFNYSDEERQQLSFEMFRRVQNILKTEGVEFDKKAVADHIMKYFPDFRRILGELQAAALQSNNITSESFSGSKTNLDELLEHIKNKKFSLCRKWINENLGLIDQTAVYRGIYDRMYEVLEKESIPICIILLDEYADKASRSIDPNITLSAFCIRAIEELSFK